MSWGEIKKALNSTLGDSGFKALDQLFGDDISALQSALQNYVSSGNIPMFKSVQQGTLAAVTPDDNKKTQEDSISISKVNPAKCICLVEYFPLQYTGPSEDMTYYQTYDISFLLSSNSISVTRNRYAYYSHYTSFGTTEYSYFAGAKWMVIEFY